MKALLERIGERVLSSVVPEAEAAACGYVYSAAPASMPNYVTVHDTCHNRWGCGWDSRSTSGIIITWGKKCGA